jgi:hypothetical protein
MIMIYQPHLRFKIKDHLTNGFPYDCIRGRVRFQLSSSWKEEVTEEFQLERLKMTRNIRFREDTDSSGKS